MLNLSYVTDNRIVMTLDAGGTNFVFSAMSSGYEIVKPITLPAESHDLKMCLNNLVQGFEMVRKELNAPPVAISFAFPGPADYPAGIIGALPNLFAFREGGVALGPFLEDRFDIPVFINNDGDLFAYGEALTGALPQLNQRLAEAGSTRRYRNLFGVTLGTGFGAGVVLNGELLMGDNAAGGDVWCMRNYRYPEYTIEESASMRAVKRMYNEFSGETSDLTPKDIYDIAEGTRKGDQKAALQTFNYLGEQTGETIATAITLIDGITVIGGGLAGASKYFMPALMKQLNAQIGMFDGARFGRMQMKAYNLDDEAEFKQFVEGSTREVKVYGTNKRVSYNAEKRVGVMLTKHGASRSIALGAYVYALNHLT